MGAEVETLEYAHDQNDKTRKYSKIPLNQSKHSKNFIFLNN